ncbi:Nuclear transport factor 2 Eukaryote [Penicillium soppii]|uniref:Nuclear transport factor 2 Eukaryote n=1 Tax=Penicillium soppii TaxID=69789 RepID=UPI0025492F38|nr:Nuclear transport factor 2 Eukaryote [Penicillium soppii]KAJ5876259.1 Nuclear transport factor 2 Eukaryote [Penicillium soppii]
MGDYHGIARAFVEHFYRTFDNYEARSSLASLYRPESKLRWEGQEFQGAQDIIAQLIKPEMKTVKTKINTTDPSPSVDNGVLVVVTGNLVIDNAFDKPFAFTSTFLLSPIPGQPGGYFIYNQTIVLMGLKM